VALAASFDKKLKHSPGHALEACGKEKVLAGTCFFFTTTTHGFTHQDDDSGVSAKAQPG
jgi:hypothetical protein